MTTTSICLHYKTIYSYVHTILFLFIKCNIKCLDFLPFYSIIFTYMFPPSFLMSTGKYHSFFNGKMEKFNHKMSYRRIHVSGYVAFCILLCIFFFVSFQCDKIIPFCVTLNSIYLCKEASKAVSFSQRTNFNVTCLYVMECRICFYKIMSFCSYRYTSPRFRASIFI